MGSQMDRAVTTEVERARECYAQRAWSAAFGAFTAAGKELELEAEDLERLAMSAYLIGRDEEYLSALDRAHQAHLQAGATLRSVRCAFWMGLRLLFRGENGRATGWLKRAERLIGCEDADCVERGYLLLPLAQQHIHADECERAAAIAATAAELGERCADHDLIACARHLEGRAFIRQGDVARGLPLLDEAMLLVTAGGLSPMVTGLIYCSVIEACQEIQAVSRAREWTSALSVWCEQQPEMVSFTGICRVHRAEIMQLHGAWREAIEEAQRVCEGCLDPGNRRVAAAGYYQRAEVHRLQGEFAEAETAYRNASQWGWEPQPGLALLRLVQGRTDVAAAAIRRVLGATSDRFERTRLLAAHVEIMLAASDFEAAREACIELDQVAGQFDSDVFAAIAAQARGTVELAQGEALAALVSLRRAWRTWQEIDAPYLAARSRVLIGLACRALGDDEGATLELDAARVTFDRLGALPDRERLDALVKAPEDADHPLTPRELQVLQLIAAGRTNKLIASELVLSEKTIDRHVSNILIKLGVPSRTAATAYAFRHRLL
jgi:DNA-binding CsgD family transcriptional regulator